MIDVFINYFSSSGFGQITIGNTVMILIGLLFIYLAISKGFEPLLLVPIGFGMIAGNIPYDKNLLSLGVYDGPPDPAYVDRIELPENLLVWTENDIILRLPSSMYFSQSGAALEQTSMDTSKVRSTIYVDRGHTYKFPINWDQTRKNLTVYEPLDLLEYLNNPTNTHNLIKIGTHSNTIEPKEFIIIQLSQGKLVLADTRNIDSIPTTSNSYICPEIIPPSQMNPWNASVFWFLYRGVKWGFYPALIFLGIGAMTDFSCLLANPKLFLLGAAAQIGIFGSFLMAIILGFSLNQAASIAIIGGADGPTAIFLTSKLAPEMLGAIALAAYSYMALVPIIQPPIMKLLTTKKERLIRMHSHRPVSKTVKIMFPVIGFILTALIAPGGMVLLAMLFFGNLLKESLVTNRLANTARNAMIDIITILLGLTVGATTTASSFLSWETIGIFILGAAAFSTATAGGVLFAKLLAMFSKEPINPLIGAAGVSAVPMAARVVQVVANKEDPQNYLLEHAMGPNVAGVIGSAVAAGVLLSKLSAT